MTRDILISMIVEKTGIKKQDVSATLNAFYGVVLDQLAKGEDVVIRKFGRFTVKRKKQGVVRNVGGDNSAYRFEGGYKADFIACYELQEQLDKNKELLDKKLKS
jgi:DNA-binding protein HU-beta